MQLYAYHRSSHSDVAASCWLDRGGCWRRHSRAAATATRRRTIKPICTNRDSEQREQCAHFRRIAAAHRLKTFTSTVTVTFAGLYCTVEVGWRFFFYFTEQTSRHHRYHRNIFGLWLIEHVCMAMQICTGIVQLVHTTAHTTYNKFIILPKTIKYITQYLTNK